MKKDTNLFLKYVGASVIGMLICGSYSIVDTVFIGQASGKTGLAAVALTWPLVMLVMAVGDLVGAGGAVLIAQAKGAGDSKEAQRVFSGTCLLGLAVAILLPLLLLPFLPPLLRWLGASPDLFDTSFRYSRILVGGTCFFVLQTIALEVVRNDGHPTICLAVSPSLKAVGIPGRPRLFEVVQKVREVNIERQNKAPCQRFLGKSSDANELKAHPSYELDYIVAVPRMGRYMEVSSQIYSIYLRHVSQDDIVVYSIDEVFIDATQYLKLYNLTAREFTMKLIREVLAETGITATAGIGTNLFLCKVAMDIVAKHIPADKDGVRIAELDEQTFREKLWEHRPLTDFWSIGHGTASRLESRGMRTLGDVARMSVQNEEVLYRLFGIKAELLIDHAWGWEPVTVPDIKAYRPESNSLSSGQVLKEPYDFEKAKIVAKEMTDMLVLSLTEKHLMTDQMVLHVGYDTVNLATPEQKRAYKGPTKINHYGREVPKSGHGSVNLGKYSSSSNLIIVAVADLFDRVVDPKLFIRRINVTANHVLNETAVPQAPAEEEQLDLFESSAERKQKQEEEQAKLDKEKRLQRAILDIKKKMGKNAMLRGMNLLEGATAKERNQQVGGHRE